MNQGFTLAEKQQRLSDIIEKIKFFNSAYDNGNESIAEDLAVKIRVLIHDTRSSKSLVGMLQDFSLLKMWSFGGEFSSTNLMPHSQLISMVFGMGPATYKPLPDNFMKRLVSFEYWWKQEVVLSDPNKNQFTRKDIILTVANKDGGAHVDDEVDLYYYNLSRNNSLGWFFQAGLPVQENSNQKISLGNPISASIRTIAMEIVKSLSPLLIA